MDGAWQQTTQNPMALQRWQMLVKEFVVVEFVREKAVEVVHYTWLEKVDGNSGKRYEELPNPADYVSYHHACLEPQPPPAYPPISLLPQNPYTRHPPNSPVYRYPPPGSRAPYICPKEQYV
ncbi:UNVERIFIED_CONTAM: hypothetical protein FKN15_019831 [Acipenser sinensis]